MNPGTPHVGLESSAHEPQDGDGQDGQDGQDDRDDRGDVQRTLENDEPSSVRYWLTWGLPIAALALLSAYLLLPSTGLPTWQQLLSERTHASAASATSSERAITSARPTPPQPADQEQGGSRPSAAPLSSSSASGAGIDAPATPGGTAAPALSSTSPPTPTQPADVLAGPVDDDVLQQLLTQSMPERLAASDPAAAASPAAQSAVDLAWQALSQDLGAGGWSQAHMQAHELVSDEHADQPGQLPSKTTVVIMWSATSSAGELQDRRMSAVKVDTTTAPVHVSEITTL